MKVIKESNEDRSYKLKKGLQIWLDNDNIHLYVEKSYNKYQVMGLNRTTLETIKSPVYQSVRGIKNWLKKNYDVDLII